MTLISSRFRLPDTHVCRKYWSSCIFAICLCGSRLSAEVVQEFTVGKTLFQGVQTPLPRLLSVDVSGGRPAHGQRAIKTPADR